MDCLRHGLLARGLVARGLLSAALVFGFVLHTTSLHAATKLRPPRDHHWQIVDRGGLTVIASCCADCPVALRMTCPHPGRGLIEMSLPIAAVSNGHGGATKLIRLTIDGRIRRLRATTQRIVHVGYVPHLELATDAEILRELAIARTLEIAFYGQHSALGLIDADSTIDRVVTKCQQAGIKLPPRGCRWEAVYACAPSAASAGALWRQQGTPGRVASVPGEGYCTVEAAADLARARRIAHLWNGYVRRECN